MYKGLMRLLSDFCHSQKSCVGACTSLPKKALGCNTGLVMFRCGF